MRNAEAAARNQIIATRRLLLAAQTIARKPVELTIVTEQWMILHALKGGE